MKATSNLPKFNIIRSGFSYLVLGMIGGEKKPVLNKVREKKFKPSELKINRRVLSHWKQAGLLDTREKNATTMLSFLELFWLQIAMELRRFGVPLENIKTTKESFFKNSNAVILETYLLRSFIQKDKDFFMIVAPDGRADVGTRDEIDFSELVGYIDSNYIKINFNIIKNRFLKDKADLISKENIPSYLEDKELSVLDIIRSGEYKAVTIKFKNGIVSHISKKDIENNPNPYKVLGEIVKNGGEFGSITFQIKDGKFVSVETDVMEKP
ncbi:MAG: hypothetical protein K9L98_01075 [Candidatus Pacebacteria bacterium]|nr:hypothetical protein [Candidatus Paceibacterota bacterium]MCF7862583.1 hypothetical protein [Candidatus Paceibacterota bacterium]